jgi:hypothetical protein
VLEAHSRAAPVISKATQFFNRQASTLERFNTPMLLHHSILNPARLSNAVRCWFGALVTQQVQDIGTKDIGTTGAAYNGAKRSGSMASKLGLGRWTLDVERVCRRRSIISAFPRRMATQTSGVEDPQSLTSGPSVWIRAKICNNPLSIVEDVEYQRSRASPVP